MEHLDKSSTDTFTKSIACLLYTLLWLFYVWEGNKATPLLDMVLKMHTPWLYRYMVIRLWVGN